MKSRSIIMNAASELSTTPRSFTASFRSLTFG